MLKKTPFYFLFTLFRLLSYCDNYAVLNSNNDLKTFKQWFTGPLFAPLAITPDPAHPGIEVTVGVQNTYGFYDSNWSVKGEPNLWSVYNYVDIQAGFNSVIGIEFLGSWTSNFRQGKNSTRIQDTILRLGLQVLNTEGKNTWVPNIRIILQETFPTGTYQKLNPDKKLTDLTGIGSYQTGVLLAFQKLYHISGTHKFQTRFSAGYFVPSSVNVKGFNAYGGGFGTKGTVSPGHYITFYLSGEYNLNDRWAIGFDANYQQNFPGNFSGKKGVTIEKLPAAVEVPPAIQFTIAPELEHTFTCNTGMLLGLWFSVFGKNNPAFASLFLAILHVF